MDVTFAQAIEASARRLAKATLAKANSPKRPTRIEHVFPKAPQLVSLVPYSDIELDAVTKRMRP